MKTFNPLLLLAMASIQQFYSTVLAVAINPVVSTTSGQLIGQKTIINNVPVYQFLGVPYAQPPVGDNRFEKPKKLIDASQNLVLAQQFKPTCMQMKHLTKAINPLLDVDEIHNISEDCLYLNIYVPANRDEPLPVMVWLPGEGFDFADARQFNGAYLASMGNVIVITVQYRVGVFGFFKDNAGLWDQLAALQWINENANSFGGNPDDVTLFGRFTGSMSISILLSSPEVINSPVALFNRAILMSGIAVGSWVFDKKHDDKVQRVIRNQGCGSIDCLKSISAKQILDNSGYDWKPVIQLPLIEDEPLEAIRNGKFSKHVKSIMLGTNQFEGSLCLLKHMAIDKPFYTKLIRNNITEQEFERIIKEDLQMFYGDDLHFGDYINGIVNNRDSYLQFCSELLIDSHMRQYDALMSKIRSNIDYNLENIFKYKVDYKPSFSIAPEFINSSIHGDDVLLAFGLAYKMKKTDKNDQQISNRMVKLFSQFALNGSPDIDSDHNIYIKLESNQSNICKWNIFKRPLLINSLMLATIALMFLLLLLIIATTILMLTRNRIPTEQIKQLLQTC